MGPEYQVAQAFLKQKQKQTNKTHSMTSNKV